MALPLLDIYQEHLDEAAFLQLRRARLDFMLEGTARHEQMLESRLETHLDALRTDIDAACPLAVPWLTSRTPNQRFVALAALLPTARADEAIQRLRSTDVPVAMESAVGNALSAYGAACGTPLIEHWLGNGDLRHQALALRLMARWGDARTEKIARRALRRPGAEVQRAAFGVLTAMGARDVLSNTETLFADCKTPEEREDVLISVALLDRESAVGYSRRALRAGMNCGSVGPVLCGSAASRDDQDLLWELSTKDRPDVSILVGLVLAGCCALLDTRWELAADPGESNGMRESAYVLLGDNVPPRILGPRAKEEPDDREARLAENAVLRTRMRAVPVGTPGRWGARDTRELRELKSRLGPRHRRWASWVCGAEH